MRLLSAFISIVQSVIAVEKTTHTNGLYVAGTKQIVLNLSALNAEK
jgi:hypothetical protein